MTGKVLAFILALADLSLLVLLVTVGDGNILREAGLATSFLLLGAMAWVLAFFNALYLAFRHGRDWRWIIILLVFLWLPAFPVLVYGASDLYTIFGQRHRRSVKQVKPRWALPPVNVASLTKSRRVSRGLLGLRKAA